MSNDEKLNCGIESAGGCHRGYSVCLTDEGYKRVINNTISKARAEVIQEIREYGKIYIYNDVDGGINRSFDDLLTKLSRGAE